MSIPCSCKKISHIPQRQWKPDIHHHRQADDLGRCFEIAKGAGFCHPVALGGANAAGKKIPLTLPSWKIAYDPTEPEEDLEAPFTEVSRFVRCGLLLNTAANIGARR
jgi:hypothetical protein